MINTIIEIDGEMEEVQLFENMFEYVDHYGSDITHYTIMLSDERNFVVDEENFTEDVDFVLGDSIKVEGGTYRKVNWGEKENSYINEKGLYKTLYSIYQNVGDGEYHNFKSMIFETEEDAQKKADELNAEVD